MKKFLSDVLVDCNLTVSGTTSLGAATGVTVASSDNSTNLATTAFVKAQGFVSTNTTYDISVPSGTTNIRLASSGGVNDDITISAAGASTVSRVSDSEIRITSTNSVDYISDVSLSGSTLSFTGVNSAFTGSVDFSALSTQLTDIETVYASVRNVSGVLIPKGTPLATVIGQTSGNVSDVVPADASDPAFMPALFVADEDIAEEAEGRAVAYGEITGIDTSLYPSGTTVYVAPGGGWTDIKPTGTDLIQNLGVITKQHNTNGGGIVTGVGRSNDVPNIPQGYAWVGNANGVATPTLLGSLAYSSATYDNYGSWNLKTNGVQRTTVQSGGNLDIVAGTDISVSYGAGGVVTINSTATGSIDYVSDVALNGNSLDFTGTGNAFAGSIDLSSLNAVSAIADLTDVDLTGLTNNAILKYDSVNQEWVVSTTNDTANATATAIVPFAIASVNTTSNGSGIGISWSNWNSSNATLDFTFSTPQPNTDYIVITDTEVFDNYYVGISNKTVNGFRAEFYDDTQSRTPSSFSEFSFIVYASDPTQQIKSSVGGINELSDVDTVTSTPSNGEALVWDGTNWVPGTISTTNNYLTGLSFNTGNGVLTATRQGLSDLTVDLDGRYLTSYTETDPVFLASIAAGITAQDLNNWNDAYNWGDHSAAGYLTSETLTELSLATNILSYRDENGDVTELDLSLYLDDTNLARLTSGTLNGTTGIATFTRDDNSTFTVDFSAFLADGNNYVDSLAFNASTGVLTLGRNGSLSDLTVDLDGRYQGAGTYNTIIGTDADINTGGYTVIDQLTMTDGVITAHSTRSISQLYFEDTRNVADAPDHFDQELSLDFKNNSTIGNSLGNTYSGVMTIAPWRDPSGGWSHQLIFSSSGATEADSYIGWRVANPDEADPAQWGTIRKLATQEWVGSQNYLTTVAWDDVTGKPSTFTPSAHTHAASDIVSGTLDGARLPWASGNDGFTGTYGIVWRAGDQPWTASWLTVNGNTDTLNTRNISATGNISLTGTIGLAQGVNIDHGAGTGAAAGTIIETFDSALYIGAFLDFTIYNDGKDSMRSGTLQLVFNGADVMFNEVNTMDIGDTTPCTLTAVNNGGTVEVVFTTPDPSFYIKYHVRTL